ncbi:MAG: iron-sulfur cluster assembly accessory protein [Pseudomonadota bacterium]
MAISLSDSAAERILSHIAARGHGVGLRLGITKTGCNGFAYKVGYADEVRADDTVFRSNGVDVVVDADALAMIDGTHVDFVRQGLNEAFRFENPNASGECGCGESFSV